MRILPFAVTFHEYYDIPNHRQLRCFQQLVQLSSSKTSTFRITGPFVGGMHRRPVDSTHKGQIMQRTLQCHGLPMLFIVAPFNYSSSVVCHCNETNIHSIIICCIHIINWLQFFINVAQDIFEAQETWLHNHACIIKVHTFCKLLYLSVNLIVYANTKVNVLYMCI